MNTSFETSTREYARMNASIEFTGNEPPVPLLTPLFGQAALKPKMLAMHTLITGMTGSGKTQSALLPLATSLLQYRLPGCAATGGLVIDPKGELLQKLRSVPSLCDRIRVIGEDGVRFNAFEFEPQLSVFDRLSILRGMVDDSMGVSTDSAHWRAMGWDFVCKLYEAHAALSEKGMDFFGRMYAILGTRRRMHDIRMISIIEETAHAGSVVAVSEQDETSDSRKNESRMDQDIVDKINLVKGSCSLRKFALFLNELGASGDNIKTTSTTLSRLIQRHRLNCTNPLEKFSFDSDLHRQLTYFAQAIGPQLTQLSDPALGDLVALDPLGNSGQIGTVSLAMMLDAGYIVLYQPRQFSENADGLMATVLRVLFQKYITRRANLQQPLVYVCDEFHRYVNCDEQYGDDVFLSFCRSYRVMACLCTQSMAALQTAIAHKKSPGLAEYATRALLNNCGNRLWFRTIDPQTQLDVRAVYPFQESHSRPHILDVRPLAKLETGTAYFLTADGREGRERITLLSSGALEPNRKAESESERYLSGKSNGAKRADRVRSVKEEHTTMLA